MPSPGVLAAASTPAWQLRDVDDLGSGPPRKGDRYNWTLGAWVFPDGSEDVDGTSGQNLSADPATLEFVHATQDEADAAKKALNTANLISSFRAAQADADNAIATLTAQGGVFLDDIKPGQTYTPQFLAGLQTRDGWRRAYLQDFLAKAASGGVDVSSLNLPGPSQAIPPQPLDKNSVVAIESAARPADAGARVDLTTASVTAQQNAATPAPQVATPSPDPTGDAGRLSGGLGGGDPSANPPPANGLTIPPLLGLLIVVVLGALLLRSGRS